MTERHSSGTQKPEVAGHIVSVVRKQEAGSKQEVEPNYKISMPLPHPPAPVTHFGR